MNQFFHVSRFLGFKIRLRLDIINLWAEAESGEFGYDV